MKGLKPEDAVARFNKMKPARSLHEHIWQQVADLILPTQGDVTNTNTPGDARYNNIMDSTAPNSADLMAGMLHSMLTSPTSYFFGLSSGSLELDAKDNVRKYFQNTVRDMHTILNESNFQTEVHSMYLNLVGMGNAPQAMEEDPDTFVRFSTRPVREIYQKQNYQGVIDEMGRLWQADARALIEEFGEENVTDRVRKAFEDGKMETFEVCHLLYPVTALQKADRKQFGGFRYVSQYILVGEKKDLEVKGYYEFPYLIPRWLVMPGEDYGRGLGEKALPETKLINLMTEVTMKGAQKTIDPPLQAPDNGYILPLITRPSGINYYRAGGNPNDRISPIFNDARIDFGYQAMDRTEKKIREAFYVDQLKLRDGPQMTALEVSERTEQGLRFLAPMLGRLTTEYLNKMVRRLYGMMERAGRLGPLPQELKDKKIRISYTSVMAMSQRMSELQNIQRTMSALAPLASIDPGILQNIETDKSFKFIARLCQFPQEMVRDKKDLDQMRAQIEEQRQAQMAQANEQTQVDSASKLMGASSKIVGNA